MNDIFQKDKDFKDAIGAFIIAFSELEFGLAFLCSFTELDLPNNEQYVRKYLGYSFPEKSKVITTYINDNLSEIKPIWDSQQLKISLLNRERKFLVHGFMAYSLPKENITTY